MPKGAPRLLWPLLDCAMRGALLAMSLWLAASSAAIACRISPALQTEFTRQSFTGLSCSSGQFSSYCEADGIKAAWYTNPTERYQHGVLGDAVEAGGLRVLTSRSSDSCGTRHSILDMSHVFEDVKPHLADLDRDGDIEVITVRSHVDLGAQVAIWSDDDPGYGLKLIATTPYIGARNRWLGLIGAADFDGDGYIEIAYVDRPHLAKTVRLWRYRNGALEPVADLAGYSNHRIGEDFISGGVRTCNGVPEMIVATANWSRIVAIRFDSTGFEVADLGANKGPQSWRAALACD